MLDLLIVGAATLLPDGFSSPSIAIEAGRLVEFDSGRGASLAIDAEGLMVLPGIIDIHGDAFERQIMPRPGIHFPLDIALRDTDAQLLANGITTALHGVTVSFEPGLRSLENARAIVDALEATRAQLGADAHLHIRFETFALDAEETVADWLRQGRVGALAYNNHAPGTYAKRGEPRRIATDVARAGLSHEAYVALLEDVLERADEVPAATARLAALARAHGVPQLSHDDRSAQTRREFRHLGAHIAEFPVTLDAAEEAARGGDPIVFGAPNVLRGGSHTGALGAATMIGRGLGSILASDYYYPALAAAPFRLAADGVLPFERAWRLVSTHPAAALGLADRGEISLGRRADLVLMERLSANHGRVVGTIADGRIAYLGPALAARLRPR